MKLERALLLFSITAIIFLAGCARAPSPTAAGVVITRFAPDIPQITSESSVVFEVDVKNIGENSAKDVKARLIGLEGWTKEATETREKAIGTGTLLRAEPELGVPEGQSGGVAWVFTSPKQTFTQTYPVDVRVGYTYSNNISASIRVVNVNYLGTISESERARLAPGVIASKSGVSPISISIIAPQVKTSKVDVTIPIFLEFKNVGGGKLFTGTVANLHALKSSDLHSIKVVRVDGITCPGNPSPLAPVSVRLSQGVSGRLVCSAALTALESFKEFKVELDIEFNYFKDASSSITVEKAFS